MKRRITTDFSNLNKEEFGKSCRKFRDRLEAVIENEAISFINLKLLYFKMFSRNFSKFIRQTPQGTNYTATCLPSRKLYKLDEPDTQDTAGEARTNSSVMYSYGPRIWPSKSKTTSSNIHRAAM